MALVGDSNSPERQALIQPLVIDQHTVAFYLQLDGAQIVLFQAMVESYEGLATVRTVDIERSLISMITTPDQVADCQTLLSSLQPTIPWRCAAAEVQNGPQFPLSDSVKSE